MNLFYEHKLRPTISSSLLGVCVTLLEKVRLKPSFLNLTVSKKNAIKQIKLLAQILLSCISKKNRLLKKKMFVVKCRLKDSGKASMLVQL